MYCVLRKLMEEILSEDYEQWKNLFEINLLI